MAINKTVFQKPDFEKAEIDLLKDGLHRSFTERFHMMTTLMKMNSMFKKANIKHQNIPNHLLEASNREKDQIDIIELEKIQLLKEE